MQTDREPIEELYRAAQHVLTMPVSEFKEYEPETTAEAVVVSLGRRSLQGDVKAFEELNKLAAFALSREQLEEALDPLSKSLAELAEEL